MPPKFTTDSVGSPAPWPMSPSTRRAVRTLRGERPQSTVVTSLAMVYGIQWHQTTVTKVVSGERPLKLTEAAAMAKIFGVPVGALVDDADTKVSANRVAVQELEKLHRQIRGRLEELRG